MNKLNPMNDKSKERRQDNTKQQFGDRSQIGSEGFNCFFFPWKCKAPVGTSSRTDRWASIYIYTSKLYAIKKEGSCLSGDGAVIKSN